MDDLRRRALRELTVELSDNINPNVLAPHLFQRNLLTRDEFERLSLQTMTTQDKNLFILQVCARACAVRTRVYIILLLPLQKLPTKGRQAFEFFVECLLQTKEEPHVELAQDLTQKLQQLIDMANRR